MRHSIHFSWLIAARAYRANLHPTLTAAALAQYLATMEPHTAALESLVPVPFDAALADLELRGGDRLLAFPQEPDPVPLLPPLRPGDTVLTLDIAGQTINTRGKRAVLIGRPDPDRQLIPDLDLRPFVAPADADAISRECIWLTYEAASQQWMATRTGRNPVYVDEYALDEGRIPLSDGARIRLHRQGGGPPLLSLAVHLAAVPTGAVTPPLPPGNHALTMILGMERPPHRMHASANLSIDQMITALLRHTGQAFPMGARVYRARLVRPASAIADTAPLLYTPLDSRYAVHTLTLRDVLPPHHAHTVSSVGEPAARRVGVRLQPNAPVPALDADLHAAFVASGNAPHIHGMHQPFLLDLIYQRQGWWAVPVIEAEVPAFVNTTRLASTPLPVAHGDTLTFGYSLDHPFARFTVAISAEVG